MNYFDLVTIVISTGFIIIQNVFQKHFNITAGSAFPGVADLLHGFDELDAEERGKRMKELRKGFNLELRVGCDPDQCFILNRSDITPGLLWVETFI